MSVATEKINEIQDQVLDYVARIEESVVNGLRTAAAKAEDRFPEVKAPWLGDKVPTATELVDLQFTFRQRFLDNQKQFAEANGFDYPLLSDESGDVARCFGVKRRFGPLPVKRKTFVIGTDRRIKAVIGSEFSMERHADEALEALATL